MSSLAWMEPLKPGGAPSHADDGPRVLIRVSNSSFFVRFFRFRPSQARAVCIYTVMWPTIMYLHSKNQVAYAFTSLPND